MAFFSIIFCILTHSCSIIIYIYIYIFKEVHIMCYTTYPSINDVISCDHSRDLWEKWWVGNFHDGLFLYGMSLPSITSFSGHCRQLMLLSEHRTTAKVYSALLQVLTAYRILFFFSFGLFVYLKICYLGI